MAENNAKKGWTPERAQEIDELARKKEQELLDELGLEGYEPRTK
ncbi:MAG: hypothetical protein PUE49_03000 [Eggerthellales bacterium]|nr:hypothetical protein [Eggerthellales bacterium]